MVKSSFGFCCKQIYEKYMSSLQCWFIEINIKKYFNMFKCLKNLYCNKGSILLDISLKSLEFFSRSRQKQRSSLEPEPPKGEIHSEAGAAKRGDQVRSWSRQKQISSLEPEPPKGEIHSGAGAAKRGDPLRSQCPQKGRSTPEPEPPKAEIFSGAGAAKRGDPLRSRSVKRRNPFGSRSLSRHYSSTLSKRWELDLVRNVS